MQNGDDVEADPVLLEGDPQVSSGAGEVPVKLAGAGEPSGMGERFGLGPAKFLDEEKAAGASP